MTFSFHWSLLFNVIYENASEYIVCEMATILPSAPLQFGLKWPVGIPIVFKTPVAVPLHSPSLPLGLCKGQVKESMDHLITEDCIHDDVIKWKHFPRYLPFVRGIHRWWWIPHTKDSDAERWRFLWFAPE